MTSEKLHVFFKNFDKLRCLIIGDVMVDSYIWGSVNRMSPEAPVPVFEVQKRENRLGGAANVALNIESLGATPVLCGVVGADAKGEIFKELLEELNLSTGGIISDENRKTTSKTRIIGGLDHMMRVDEEVLHHVSSSIKESVKEFVAAQISNGIDVIIFEDYDKGVLSEDLIQYVIQLAHENSIPTCVDPKKNNFGSYGGATLFKPNFKELVEGLEVEIDKDDFNKISEQGKSFVRDRKIKQMLITLSEHGMMMIQENETFHVKALKRNIVDVSGAGDTVISTAALALASGCDPDEVATIANLAGGIVCEEVGVVPIEKDTLVNEYNKLY